uniref:Uncharacterized protein n=1 Tax=Anguilla anguilla TaxID=7936 RepID=A0A0E9ULW7_ANGAN
MLVSGGFDVRPFPFSCFSVKHLCENCLYKKIKKLF